MSLFPRAFLFVIRADVQCNLFFSTIFYSIIPIIQYLSMYSAELSISILFYSIGPVCRLHATLDDIEKQYENTIMSLQNRVQVKHFAFYQIFFSCFPLSTPLSYGETWWRQNRTIRYSFSPSYFFPYLFCLPLVSYIFILFKLNCKYYFR